MNSSKRQAKPRLLLMGQRRSFIDFQVWDFPGGLDYFDPTFDTTLIFKDIRALIWVVNTQDDYTDSLARLTATIINLQSTFSHINVEVFVHKTDSLNEEYRSDIFQGIVQRVRDDLNVAGFINLKITYHLTSIYDSSISEALSNVIQKLVPVLDVLQNLLNTLIDNSGMVKAYLFDILSKIYVASDTRPVDSDIYEICANYIDLTVDFSNLYNYQRDSPKVLGEQMEEVESSMTFDDGTMVYLKEMDKHLCLVTVIKNKEAKDKKGMIDYNVHIFQEALKTVFNWRTR
ncbi:GTP-binding protein gtr2 [Exophiala xenobiotica]|uniref:GTP-binding protein n=1 Tax=Lithohypha guttulata TaxID=1690604 RepID=A0ABR0JWF3_9EURO|nr:GTP-binding protein gtr2 [Lithohypha guttulata]KAK5309414.1 GTP-binding protein gtr2 [Exophiala xenobiotica]